MHRQISAAEIEIDSDSGYITKIHTVSAPEHLPLAVTDKCGKADRSALNRWWLERSIPATRSGLRDALNLMDIADSKQLLARCYGLSLSDQYWVKPESSGLSWKTINFLKIRFRKILVMLCSGKRSMMFSVTIRRTVPRMEI